MIKTSKDWTKKYLTYMAKNAYALVRKETSNLIRKTGKG